MYTLRAYKAAFNSIGGKKKVHNHKEFSCLLKMNNINHIQLSFLFKLFINKTNIAAFCKKNTPLKESLPVNNFGQKKLQQNCPLL